MLFDLMKICFSGIAEVIVVGILAALLIRNGNKGQDAMDVLSRLFVRITLPCLVFTNMATKFDIDGVPHWWIFPLLGIGLFVAGGALANLFARFDRSIEAPGVFTASVTFHNSILLPLAFAPVIFDAERLPSFLNLLFLYNILTVPSFFSVGLWMVHTSSDRKFRMIDLVNPPIIATLLGLLFAFTGWAVHVPGRAMDVMRLFGALSTPLSIIIVGGAIVTSFSTIGFGDWKEPVKIAILKSLVMPLLAALFVFLIRPPSDIALFIVMGSAMPVGSIIAAIIPPDERIRKTVAGGILLTNLASVLVVPVFLSIYGLLYGW